MPNDNDGEHTCYGSSDFSPANPATGDNAESINSFVSKQVIKTSLLPKRYQDSGMDDDVVKLVEGDAYAYVIENGAAGAGGTTDVNSTAKKVALSGPVAVFINIIKANVGSGILGTPFAFLCSGLYLGIAGTIFILICSIFCTILLLDAKHKLQTSGKKYGSLQYGDIAKIVLGPAGLIITEFFLLFTQTGFCIAYLIFIANNLALMIHLPRSIPAMGVIAIWVSITVVAMIPVTFIRSLKWLAPFCVLAEITISIGLGVVLYFDLKIMTTSPTFHDNMGTLFGWDWKTLTTFPTFFGITVYAFEGIGLVLPIEDTMKRPEQFKGVFYAAMSFIAVLMISFGALGYLAFGSEVLSIITENLEVVAPRSVNITLQVMLIIALFFTYPVQLVPVTQIVDKYFNRYVWRFTDKNNIEVRAPPRGLFHRQNVIRVVLVLFTGVVATVGSDYFGDVLAIVGGLGGTALAFIIPAIIHTKLLWHELPRWKIVRNLLLVVFGVVGSIFCLVESIMSMAHAKAH